MDDDGLDPREGARTRRRDRDATAAERDLLRPGMGKVFKQITDRQQRVAREEREDRDRSGPRASAPDRRSSGADRAPRGRG